MTWRKVGALDGVEKTIAILGDRRWPQTAKQVGDKMSKKFIFNMRTYGKNVRVGSSV